MNKFIISGLALTLMLCIFTAPTLAQTPTWSRGVQNLPLSFDECKTRARRALEAEGYTIDNQGGENHYNSPDFYFGGYKDVHNAVIACSSAPDGKTWANIFVASCLSTRNGNVPGAERVKLQERMGQPVGNVSSKFYLGRWSGPWRNSKNQSGNSYISFSESADGKITGDEDGVFIQNVTVSGNVVLFKYIWRECRRVEGRLVINADGKTASGSYTVTECNGIDKYTGTYIEYKKE